jgi:hypothetical protein
MSETQTERLMEESPAYGSKALAVEPPVSDSVDDVVKLEPADIGSRAHARGLRPWMMTFLVALAKEKHISKACKAARVSRDTAYEYRGKVEGFRELWNELIEEQTDDIEAAAVEVATEGHERTIYGKDGSVKGTERIKDVNAMKFLLTGRRPKVYQPKQEVEVTHGITPELKNILLEVRTKRNIPSVRNLPASEVKTLEVNDKTQDGASSGAKKPGV